MGSSFTDSSSSSSSGNQHTNLEKIENYFKTISYRECLEVSASFNSRLSMERRMRLPFLDPQTGVAQRHCALLRKAKHRMPPMRCGQIYSFPALRWRKTRRQYLIDTTPMMSSSSQVLAIAPEEHVMGLDSSGGFLNDDNSNTSFLERSQTDVSLDGGDHNSRDTNNNSREELSRDWLYDDPENDFETLSEPKSPDDEYDYDPRYGNKKRLKKTTKKEPKSKKSHTPPFGSGSETRRKSAKDPSQTPKKSSTENGSAEKHSGRPRKKRATGANKKNLAEPPSFESAAAAVVMDEISFDSRDFEPYPPFV